MNIIRTNMVRLFCILSIVTFAMQNLQAQIYNEVKRETMIELGDEALAGGDYYTALDWFDQAYKEERDLSLGITIARLHYELRNYKNAERWYERLVKRDKENELTEERFMLAKLLKEQGKYDKSIEQFLQFLDLTTDDSLKQLTYRELKGIKLLDSLEDNIEAVISPMDRKINSAFSEYSPMEYDDGSLYFASFMRKKVIEVDEEDDYHAKIYTTKMGENRKGEPEFEDPVPMGEHINRKGFHSSNLAFSSDGKKMFFNRQSLEGNSLDISEIYVSYFKGGEWSPAVAVGGVNGEFISKHPAPGELYGNEVLFFSSNMPGGYGGFDLYYSTMQSDGNYSTPNNLGKEINTSGDEVTPFYNDGTLYFSTNGHPTIGGYDIYYTSWTGSGWTGLSNMGDGYNSSYDDLYLRFNGDATKGYLVSNRPYKKKRKLESETCCDDIFSVEIREIIIDLLAKVQDANGPLIGSTMELKDLGVDEYPRTKSEPNATEYRYLLESDRSYKVVVRKDGYFPDSLEFNTAGILDDYTVNKTITLREIPKVAEPEPEPETETITINEPIRMNNIYYDFDDDKILQDAEIDLNLILGLMQDYPEMKIELSSHTDAQGVSTYNEKLSQRRADSAKRWLEQKGIQGDRIEAVGYGENVILNHCVNGVRCSDEEHRQNRRTEFKILEGPQTIEIQKRKTIIRSSEGGGQYFGKKVKSKYLEIFEQQNPVPIIKFEEQTINIGEIKKGDSREVTFVFTNSGTADLKIDLVTACKCTTIEWTKEIIKPGEMGAIRAVYDSTNEKPGELHKTLDIIANTDPIVVEAFIEGMVKE